jgi:hypothetical protein
LRKTDTLGQRVRQRFNEEINYDDLSLTAKKLDRRNLDSKTLDGLGSVKSSIRSGQSASKTIN